ncbi:MAG: hypothetical protein U0802_21145 [Candidatus Binatia bacterium]
MTPGTTFAYANMNYVVVGAMIERVTGRTWTSHRRARLHAAQPAQRRPRQPGLLGRVDAPLGMIPPTPRRSRCWLRPTATTCRSSVRPASPTCRC